MFTKLRKNKKLFLGFVYIIIALILIFYKQGVNFQIGTVPTVTTQQGYSLENITGDLLIGPGKSLFDQYISIFNGTRLSLDFWMYSLTYDEIIKLIKSLSLKGVKIRFVLENSKYKDTGKDFEKLIGKFSEGDVEIKNDQGMGTTYVHAKTFIIDNEKFVIQTANLTYSSFFKNREMFFVGRDGKIVNSLKNIFEKDWERKRIEKSDIHPNLLVCNIDCREKIEWYLKSAQKSIWIQTPNIEDKSLIAILTGKTGLDTKIILSDTEIGDKERFGKLDLKFQKSPYLHAKTILIDDKVLIIGSINLTQNSMDKNREISIALIDPNLIKRYKNSFLSDWNTNK